MLKKTMKSNKIPLELLACTLLFNVAVCPIADCCFIWSAKIV